MPVALDTLDTDGLRLVLQLQAQQHEQLVQRFEQHEERLGGLESIDAVKGWYDTAAAGVYMSCGKEHVQDLHQRGELKVDGWLGRHPRFRRASLDDYMEGRPSWHDLTTAAAYLSRPVEEVRELVAAGRLKPDRLEAGEPHFEQDTLAAFAKPAKGAKR